MVILRHLKRGRGGPPTRKDCDMQLDVAAEVGERFYVFETKSGAVLSIDKWVDRTDRKSVV